MFDFSGILLIIEFIPLTDIALSNSEFLPV